MYWPNMADDISKATAECPICEQDSPAQAKQSLLVHEIPKEPWGKVGLDLFCCKGKDYLVVVDYLTDFFEVAELPNTLASAVVNATKQQFARHGVPMIVHTDGGPQFMSKEFRWFEKAWEFQHTVSSPYNSRSNGKAESAVKIAKKNCLRGVLIPIWPCWTGATRPPLGCKQAPVNVCWPGEPGELCRQVGLNWSGNLKMVCGKRRSRDKGKYKLNKKARAGVWHH